MAVEKEAYAIVESLRRWRHYLIGRYFMLIMDQKSVAFIFNPKTASKIKKIENTKVENGLSCFSFDVSYQPSKENAVVDVLSRVCSSTTCRNDL